jgi:hypothetical protein
MNGHGFPEPWPCKSLIQYGELNQGQGETRPSLSIPSITHVSYNIDFSGK